MMCVFFSLLSIQASSHVGIGYEVMNPIVFIRLIIDGGNKTFLLHVVS